MTKRDLVIRISNETGLVQQSVLDVVQKTLDYIAEAVAQGKKVELRNFGVFEVKVRKARIGRNPNAPANDVRIPPRAVVKFKPGKEMREAVLKLTPDGGAQPPAPAPKLRVLLSGRFSEKVSARVGRAGVGVPLNTLLPASLRTTISNGFVFLPKFSPS